MANALRYSQTFDNGTYWSSPNVTWLGGQSDPFGGTAAYKATSNATGATYFTQNADAGGTSRLTYSIYLKRGNGSSNDVGIWNGAGWAYVGRVNWNVGDGTISSVTNTQSGGAITYTNEGGGWYRIIITTTASYSGASSWSVYIGTWTGSSVGQYVYVYGAQAEAATSASAYTPTDYVDPSPTPTPSTSIAASPSVTPSVTITPTVTPSISVSPSVTPSVTPSNTPSVSPTPSVTPSETPSVTPSGTPAPTPTVTPSLTPTLTPSLTPTVTPSVTPMATPSPTISATPAPTPTITPTATPSCTPAPSPSRPSTLVQVKNPTIQKPYRLYKDIDLNFLAHPDTHDVTKKLDVNAVKQALMVLINVSFGEWLFHPEKGSGVPRILFEPVDPITTEVLRNSIEQVIQNYEPRAILTNLQVTPYPEDNAYEIYVEVNIVGLPNPVTFTFTLERLR